MTPVVDVLLAAVLAGVVLLPRLGHRVLADWDEGIYAEIAREMLAGGNWRSWLEPHWNGHLWFEKPPLEMWLTACSLHLFGLNAWAARLPSALAGIASVALLQGFLCRAVSRTAAWIAAVVLLASFGFQHVARVGETDTLLSLFCLVAVVGLAELGRGAARGWIVFLSGLALAVMTKGAASVPLLLAAGVVFALQRRALPRVDRPLVTGVALFAVLTLPWHVYCGLRFGRDFWAPYLGLHVVTRATSAIEGHHTAPWFFLWVLLVSAPLFSLVYPVGVVEALRGRLPVALQPFAVFALVEFVLFSAVRTRLPHYIAPAYPAFAAVTGGWLASPLVLARVRRVGWAPALGVAAILYGACTAATARARHALHTPELRGGYTTPDNREAAGLLDAFAASGLPAPPGPLLVWREDPVVPVTTDAFYARRVAVQVSTTPPPKDLAPDMYFNDPVPLGAELDAPRLVLLDKTLVARMPDGTLLRSLLTGPTLIVGVLRATAVPATTRAAAGRRAAH